MEVPRASLKVLDQELPETYINRLKAEKPNISALADETIYELMSITKDGMVTLSSLLLFCKYPQAYFPQLCITAVVLPGDDIGDIGGYGERFVDNKRIEGNLPEMLDQALAFVRKNMRIKTIINPNSGKREDRTDYPIIAVREALLNTLVHRDYSIHTEGMPIQILMYPDRIEIRNPGGIYGRLRVDQLGKMQPDTRNPVLVTALEVMGLTENRYSGIPTIRRSMKDFNLEDPVFADERGTFTVILYNRDSIRDNTSQREMTEKEEELLNFLKIPRSRNEIAEHLGIGTIAYVMQTYINPLVEKGLVRLTIPEKPKSPKQRFVRK